MPAPVPRAPPGALRFQWGSHLLQSHLRIQSMRHYIRLHQFHIQTETTLIFQPPPHQPPKLPHQILLPPLRPPNNQIPSPIHLRLPLPRIPTSNPPPTLLNNNPPSSHIPRPTSPLPIRVQIAASNSAAIQRCAAERAERMHHTPFLTRKPGERASFDIPIITAPLVAPFHSHKRLLQTF